MTNTKKMTQKDYFNEIIALATANNREDIVEFCNGRIEVLNRKKSGGSRKPSKAQQANAVIKDRILEVLADGTKKSIKELSACEGLDFSSQKLSALLRQLGENGTNQIVRIENKDRSVSFALVGYVEPVESEDAEDVDAEEE